MKLKMMEFDMFPARGFAHMMIMLMMMTMKMRVLIMMESHLLPAQSLSLLLRCPHHPMLVPLLQAGSAHTFHLKGFTLTPLSPVYTKYQPTLLILGCF